MGKAMANAIWALEDGSDFSGVGNSPTDDGRWKEEEDASGRKERNEGIREEAGRIKKGFRLLLNSSRAGEANGEWEMIARLSSRANPASRAWAANN